MWLKEHKPHLTNRVLFMTGDTASRDTRVFVNETGLPFLTKPFTMGDARALICQVLASGEAGLPENALP
ncbi:MAG: hypothetical protein GTN93_15005 [Anaerolineae bacterium]|nr:hypothetical protein [Anaerolineae bacterium]